MITYLLLLVLSGLVVGALGRLAVPGPDPMGIGMTILVGIGGSLIGGLVGYALFHRPAGLIFSVLGATLIVFLIRKSRGGSLDDPYGRRRQAGYGRPRRGFFGR
jgi:uncharacterized membrane protein YeaQ/YmgE (transglycosylase-associated protein family)